MQFVKAERSVRKARLALVGPSGSGKTKTALEVAVGLGGKIAVIDTENSSASLYADEYSFDALALASFAPAVYVEALSAAAQAGYDVVIVDSLSHAWVGKDGALAMVDKASVKYQGNSYAAWRDVTPEHNALVDALVFCPAHLIVTLRSKTAYEIQKDEKSGKMKPVKIGMQPVQRDGLEYEFDVVGDMDLDHNFIVSKSRYAILDGALISKPTKELGAQIAAWLAGGTAEPQAPVRAAAPKPVAVPPAQKSRGGGPTKIGDDGVSKFWALVNKWELDKEQASELLRNHGQNFALAYEALKASLESERPQ